MKSGREDTLEERYAIKCCLKPGKTPELMGQIKNFMAKHRRVSIGTISEQFDISVGTVHTIIPEEPKMRKLCEKFVPSVLGEDHKERCCHDSREMVELINPDPAVLDALVTCDESWIYSYEPEINGKSSHWKHTGSPRSKKTRQSKSTHKLLMIRFFFNTGIIYVLRVPTGQTVNKEYYVTVLREYQEEIPS